MAQRHGDRRPLMGAARTIAAWPSKPLHGFTHAAMAAWQIFPYRYGFRYGAFYSLLSISCRWEPLSVRLIVAENRDNGKRWVPLA